jgi:hypothetical protein
VTVNIYVILSDAESTRCAVCDRELIVGDTVHEMNARPHCGTACVAESAGRMAAHLLRLDQVSTEAGKEFLE